MQVMSELLMFFSVPHKLEFVFTVSADNISSIWESFYVCLNDCWSYVLVLLGGLYQDLRLQLNAVSIKSLHDCALLST